MGKRQQQRLMEDGGLSDSSNSDNERYSAGGSRSRSGRSNTEFDTVLEDEANLVDRSKSGRGYGRTKEDAIYGVFASDDSNPNGGHSYTHQARRRAREHAPISFVKADKAVPDESMNKEARNSNEADCAVSDSGKDSLGSSDGNSPHKTNDRHGAYSDAMDISSNDGGSANDDDDDDDAEMHPGIGSTASEVDLGRKRDDKKSRDRDDDDDRPSFEHICDGNFNKADSNTKTPTQFKSAPYHQQPQHGAMSKSKTDLPKKWERPDKDFAKFERYTKGFGSKMLAKMGYVPGKGLGSGGEGITAPIDVKLRPSGMGLGHGGFDERTETVKREMEDKAENSNDARDQDPSRPRKGGKEEKRDGWKRSSAGQKKSAKPLFKTAQDVLLEQASLNSSKGESTIPSAVQPTKIIDMTSKQPRVLTSMSQASQGSASSIGPNMSGRIFELRHNMLLITDLNRSDLLHISSNIKIETSHKGRAESDIKSLQVLVEDEKLRLGRLERIRELVMKCRSISLSNPVHTMDMSDATNSGLGVVERIYGPVFEEMQREFMPEYKQLGLDTLVVSTLLPWFKAMLRGWSVLENPSFGADVVKRWRSLLVVDSISSNSSSDTGFLEQDDQTGEHSGKATMTPLESMLYTVWLPRVRQAVNNDWDVSRPDEMIALLEAWYIQSGESSRPNSNRGSSSILPTWLFQNIAHQLIIPKLMRAVEEWEPRQRTSNNRNEMMAHTWIHPWLPILGDLLDPLCVDVRRKLESSWRDWSPKDHSPLLVIKSWISVFSKSDLEHLLSTSIIPSLIVHLRTEFTISPETQDLGPLVEDVFPWCHIISPPLFSHLLATEFFAPWCRVLWTWIASPGANLDEVSSWYISWKRVFEEAEEGAMKELPCIGEGWRTALDMMNQGVTLRASGYAGGAGARMPTLPAFMNAFNTSASITGNPSSLASLETTKTAAAFAATPQITFKDYIESVAADRNLPFVPLNRDHPVSGKPIYRLGKRLMVYIENGVLFVPPAETPNNKNGGKSGGFEQARRDWMHVSVEDAMTMAAET
ncbi:hypothetical protein BASA50_009890 [Batrachochytrium salamandrivorans]|uniref:G-patch domain-containing protein n=1 Tax=Batrachochytrium salamandrivorans TaxID=1357716 RepID=A0ABQ8F023_9FUNG|nr:hypothetical protein BASA50_009890 [Batrachochytrium salamandrivorans]